VITIKQKQGDDIGIQFLLTRDKTGSYQWGDNYTMNSEATFYADAKWFMQSNSVDDGPLA
jgi:hypothetical protein